MTTLTKDQIEQNAAAVKAHLEGKPVQYRDSGSDWRPAPAPVWDFVNMSYRPAPAAPEPKPWDCPGDVPGPVCWIRKHEDLGNSLVIGVGPDGIGGVFSGSVQDRLWCDLKDYEHSTDRKTWKPCTKAP